MTQLETKIGYTFKDPRLLETALTHSSYANEHQKQSVRCNERLEFFGDSILSIVVSEYLFKDCPDVYEGELTRRRAALVCEESLFGFAKQIELGRFIRLGRGELATGGAERPSILSDCFEALIAAIYLDGGMPAAREFVLGFVEPQHQRSQKSDDYKTKLQEVVQKDPAAELRYALIGESGPDHEKLFTIEVRLNGAPIAAGSGNSKKRAEQDAARAALEQLDHSR